MMRETLIDHDTAAAISKDVETLIRKSGIKVVTAPLIRELVNAKLIEKGLENARKMHTRLGMPIYDVDSLILHPEQGERQRPSRAGGDESHPRGDGSRRSLRCSRSSRRMCPTPT